MAEPNKSVRIKNPVKLLFFLSFLGGSGVVVVTVVVGGAGGLTATALGGMVVLTAGGGVWVFWMVVAPFCSIIYREVDAKARVALVLPEARAPRDAMPIIPLLGGGETGRLYGVGEVVATDFF